MHIKCQEKLENEAEPTNTVNSSSDKLAWLNGVGRMFFSTYDAHSQVLWRQDLIDILLQTYPQDSVRVPAMKDRYIGGDWNSPWVSRIPQY